MGSPIRIMLTGIALIILGVFFLIDTENDLNEYAYIFEVIGILLVLFGQFKEGIMRLIDRN